MAGSDAESDVWVGARSWAALSSSGGEDVPRSLPPEGEPRCAPAPYRREILAGIRPLLVGHTVDVATAQPPPRTTARSKPTPPLAHPLAQHGQRQAPTQADEAVMDTAGDHADPGHPSRTPACPTPHSTTSPRSDTADAGTHGHRTPGRSDARTGHRTPVAWTGTRGHWTLTPDTEHWTPDASRGRGHSWRGIKRRRHPDLLDHHAERSRAGTPNRVLVDGDCGAWQPVQAGR